MTSVRRPRPSGGPKSAQFALFGWRQLNRPLRRKCYLARAAGTLAAAHRQKWKACPLQRRHERFAGKGFDFTRPAGVPIASQRHAVTQGGVREDFAGCRVGNISRPARQLFRRRRRRGGEAVMLQLQVLTDRRRGGRLAFVERQDPGNADGEYRPGTYKGNTKPVPAAGR